MWVPQNGWFRLKNPIKTDDWGKTVGLDLPGQGTPFAPAPGAVHRPPPRPPLALGTTLFPLCKKWGYFDRYPTCLFYFMENPIQTDDLGVHPHFRKPPNLYRRSEIDSSDEPLTYLRHRIGVPRLFALRHEAWSAT